MVVYEMLEQGESRPAIGRYAAAWNVRTRQPDTFMAGARELLIVHIERDKDYYWALAVERFNALFSMALEAGNYRAAIQVQSEINKFCGFYAA